MTGPSEADFHPQDMLLNNLGWVVQRTHKAVERSFWHNSTTQFIHTVKQYLQSRNLKDFDLQGLGSSRMGPE